jgi:hypothetical protein
LKEPFYIMSVNISVPLNPMIRVCVAPRET